MSWKRWNNRTRRMFILIVSLLFVLQSITIIGLAEIGDDDENDGSDGSNNNTDSSVNGTGDGDDPSNTTNEEGDDIGDASGEIKILSDIFNRFSTPKSEENTAGTSTIITEDVETNKVTTVTYSSKLEKYVEALSNFSISLREPEPVFKSSFYAKENVLTVASNESTTVTILGEEYLIYGGGEINVKIPELVVDSADRLLVTAEKGGSTYAEYVFLDNNEGDVYQNQDNQDSLLQFLSNMLSNMFGLYCFGK